MEKAFGLSNLELSRMTLGKCDCMYDIHLNIHIVFRKGIASFGGQIFMVGNTYGNFIGTANAGSSDVFVTQFDADGSAFQTDQFGSPQDDSARY